MIKELRRKFIIISVTSVFVVMLIMAATINIMTYAQIEDRAHVMLDLLNENNGMFPKPDKEKNFFRNFRNIDQEDTFSTRFFTITFDELREIGALNLERMPDLDAETAISIAGRALAKGKERGAVGSYRYIVAEKSYGQLIIVIDCGRDIEVFKSFLINSVLISFFGVGAVFLLVLIFSNTAIAPLIESYEKQKQFITDASHELKTPLAIIGTNTEVLEMDYGESEWTKSIRNQVGRLAELVSNLVTLTRMDEEKWQIKAVDFSLTDAVAEVAEPFQTLCEAQGKVLVLDIEKKLTYLGDEEAVRQLTSILLENAAKYAREESVIQCSLKKQGKKYIIEVCNEADNIEQGKLDVFFERFYRADSSRNSRTGGHGIGLSIAKAIVKKHKGKIHAQSPDGQHVVITAQL